MTPIRELERHSIERFLLTQVKKLGGQVLDIGCGKQPYRHIVENSGGTYYGYDRPGLPGSVVHEDVGEYWDLHDEVDTIIMTQVWQYIPMDSLQHMLYMLGSGDWSLKRGGWFLVTGPTNWPVTEPADLHRFTANGVRQLLKDSLFEIELVEERAVLDFHGTRWPLGFQAVARSRA